MAPKQDPKPKFQEGRWRETNSNNNKKAASLRLKGGGFVVVEVRALKQWCPGMEPEPQSLCHTACLGFIQTHQKRSHIEANGL